MTRNQCVVSLCVNDVRGTDLHRVRAVTIEDLDGSQIELESGAYSDNDGDACYPVSFRIGDGVGGGFGSLVRIRVGHALFNASGHRPHYGNLCWDGVGMKRSEVRRLVRYLVVTRKWIVTDAPLVSDLLPDGTP